MAELKPCPFCGCEDIQVITTTHQCIVCCRDCHANMTKLNLMASGSIAETMQDAHPRAIEAWNRRAENGNP